MPEKKTMAEARKAKRQGKSPSTQAGPRAVAGGEEGVGRRAEGVGIDDSPVAAGQGGRAAAAGQGPQGRGEEGGQDAGAPRGIV